MQATAISVHDRMIDSAISYLQQQGHQILSADHVSGFNRPVQIGSYIPDIISRKFSTIFVFEVETEEGLLAQHTKEQWQGFATYARTNGYRFGAIVPGGRATAAQTLASNWGIKIDDWLYYN